MLKFDYIESTGLSQDEILRRANKLFKYLSDRFGEEYINLQYCIDSVIDSAIEYAQGN